MPEVPIFVPNVPIIIPSYPTAPPPLLEEPQPQPVDPSILVDPTCIFPNPNPSSSSESLESQETPVSPGVPDSSSEELGAGVARPPFNFRYRPLRRRRQALVTAKPPHTPVFLAEFPSSPSPFRSCPGPSRYTTV